MTSEQTARGPAFPLKGSRPRVHDWVRFTMHGETYDRRVQYVWNEWAGSKRGPMVDVYFGGGCVALPVAMLEGWMSPEAYRAGSLEWVKS